MGGVVDSDVIILALITAILKMMGEHEQKGKFSSYVI